MNPCVQETLLTRLHLGPSPKQVHLRPCALPPSAVTGGQCSALADWPCLRATLALGQESRNRGYNPPLRTRSFIWKDVV